MERRGCIIRGLSVFTALSVMISGCGYGNVSEIVDDYLPQEDYVSQYESLFDNEQMQAAPVEQEYDNTIIVIEEEENENHAASLPKMDLSKAQLRLQADGYYNFCYSNLNEMEKQIYVEIYDALITLAEDVKLSTLDAQLVDRIFNCVMIDHPEIFYVTGYTLTKYTLGEKIQKITLSGTYTMSAQDVQQKQLAVDAYVTKCLAGINKSASEYEKVKYVYEYLIQNTEYDLESENNQNILSVCENSRSVCQGYAKTYQYLLNRLNVFCTLVKGRVIDRESHVWNLVQVDGEYYYVDPTWGDASYTLSRNTPDEKTVQIEAPKINYDYLCVPENMINKTHVIDALIPLPPCTSMNANYYVREGMYFASVDTKQLQEMFSNAYQSGKLSVTIKCADTSVYEEMLDYLISQECIFDYLEGGNSVSYVKMDNVCAILIYL